jgi:lipopolysaccharide transport system ATP-binding protein
MDSLHGASGAEGHWALRGCSFDIRRGEVLGVVGRNGAGKSTMLRVLSRTLRPHEGRVYVRGPVASMLDLSAGMDPGLCGRENMERLGVLIGLDRATTRRAQGEAIAFSDLGPWVERPVATYSAGMRMRLAFGFLTSLPFEVLVVDEVLAVGDPAFARRCVDRIWDLAHRGRTLVVASHDHPMLRWLCSLTLWLDEGQVRHVGPTDWVINHYEWFLGVRAASEGPVGEAGERAGSP